MSETDGIDPRALSRLRDLGGPDFLHQMIGLFLEMAQEKIAAAQAAARVADLAGLAKAVHPLRSSSGNVGAQAMEDLATRIEQLAHDRQAASIPPLLRDLETAFARVRPRLEKEREALRA